MLISNISFLSNLDTEFKMDESSSFLYLLNLDYRYLAIQSGTEMWN